MDGPSFHAELIDAGSSADQAAIAFLAAKLGVAPDSLEIRSGYEGETSTHVYISQKLVSLSHCYTGGAYRADKVLWIERHRRC